MGIRIAAAIVARSSVMACAADTDSTVISVIMLAAALRDAQAGEQVQEDAVAHVESADKHCPAPGQRGLQHEQRLLLQVLQRFRGAVVSGKVGHVPESQIGARHVHARGIWRERVLPESLGGTGHDEQRARLQLDRAQ